jgi:hypothetical protein
MLDLANDSGIFFSLPSFSHAAEAFRIIGPGKDFFGPAKKIDGE